MDIPNELKYSKDHMWVKVSSEIAVIGYTDYAQNSLSEIVFVELPNPETDVEINNQIGTVESVKSVSDLFSPISGRISEVNKKLESDPNLINKSPYKDGWMAKIIIKNNSELDNLMSAEDYKKIIKD